VVGTIVLWVTGDLILIWSQYSVIRQVVEMLEGITIVSLQPLELFALLDIIVNQDLLNPSLVLQAFMQMRLDCLLVLHALKHITVPFRHLIMQQIFVLRAISALVERKTLINTHVPLEHLITTHWDVTTCRVHLAPGVCTVPLKDCHCLQDYVMVDGIAWRDQIVLHHLISLKVVCVLQEPSVQWDHRSL